MATAKKTVKTPIADPLDVEETEVTQVNVDNEILGQIGALTEIVKKRFPTTPILAVGLGNFASSIKALIEAGG